MLTLFALEIYAEERELDHMINHMIYMYMIEYMREGLHCSQQWLSL